MWDRKSRTGRAIRWPLRLIPTGTVLPILSGPLRGRRWETGSAPHGAWFGTLERASLRAFARSLKSGMDVWDVGANVGLYTLCAAPLVAPGGIVHAFEPIPENVECLERHLELNDVGNVVVEQSAVLDSEGFALMRRGDSPSEWRVDVDGEGETRVPAVALDAWRERIGASLPGALKIDVEGAEFPVLRGAAETLRAGSPAIFLSLHGEQQRQDCSWFLLGLGYRLRAWGDDVPIEDTSEWMAER